MEQRTTQQHRHHTRWLIALVTCLIALGIGGFSYASYYHERFKPATINGVTVTNLSVKQATDKLNQAMGETGSVTVASTKVAVTQSNVKRLLDKRNADGHPVSTVKLKLTQAITSAQRQYRLTTGLTQFKQKIAAINLKKTKTVDAKAVLKNGRITVQSGHTGTALDEDAMVTTYRKQVSSASVMSVKWIVKQAVSGNSATLASAKKTMTQTLSRSVTIAFPSKTVTLKASDYLKSGSASADGTMHFDEQALKQEIARLATKYDTKGKAGKFKTHSGTTITVPSGGTWGWSISQAKLIARVMAGFEGTRTQSIDLADYVTGTGYGKSSTVGGTYIEVDLKHLREYAYVNGKLKFSTKVMSGTITGGNKTPQGFYYIMYKQRNTYLRGTNDDGSSYKSKVKYWMPITNDGVGLHDSSWQPSYVYGNTSYRSDYHSHGCINNPPSKMGTLYGMAYAGEPVVIYD